jgi:MFS family permease
MAGSAALIASLLYLPSYPLLVAAVGLVSLVGQLYRPASATLMAELTPEPRQIMVYAMYRFGGNLGTTAAPLIGFALYNLDQNQYDLLFWGEALVAVVYALLAWAALPARTRSGTRTKDETTGSYLAVLRDRRYTLYLIATFANAAVYMQYLSTLPLDVQASGLAIFWYTLAVALNGFIVIAFELMLTKVSQHWPFRVTVVAAFALVGVGMACYGLPMAPAVIIIGTLIWTVAEIIGGPSGFAYPAVAGPAHLRARYIGSFQFMFGLGTALGPILGGALFARLGHAVWPVIALGSVVAVVCGLAGIRTPKPADAQESGEPASGSTQLAASGAPSQ